MGTTELKDARSVAFHPSSALFELRSLRMGWKVHPFLHSDG